MKKVYKLLILLFILYVIFILLPKRKIIEGNTDTEPSLCAVNDHVVNNACVACPAGTTRAAGDDASGADTACNGTTLCAEDQHVVSNACVACPAGTTRAAGDDASGADTACDETTPSGGEPAISNDCPPNENCTDLGGTLHTTEYINDLIANGNSNVLNSLGVGIPWGWRLIPGGDWANGCSCMCDEGYKKMYGDRGCLPNMNILTHSCWNENSAECMVKEVDDFIKESIKEEKGGSPNPLSCNDLRKVEESGCFNRCLKGSGGTEVSEAALHNTMNKYKYEAGCEIPIGFALDSLTNNDMGMLVMYGVVLELDGYTYESYNKLSSIQKDKLYLDTSIENINEIKNKIINKLESHGNECTTDINRCINSLTQEHFQVLSDENFLPADGVNVEMIDLLPKYMFNRVIFTHFIEAFLLTESKKLIVYRRVQNDLNLLSTLFQGLDTYRKDYKRWLDDFNEESARLQGDEAARAAFRKHMKSWGTWNAFPDKEDSHWNQHIIELMCRNGLIDNESLLSYIDTPSNYDAIKEICNSNYCGGREGRPMARVHICPSLKYKNKSKDLKGNTNDECCDISMFDKIKLWFVDLFD